MLYQSIFLLQIQDFGDFVSCLKYSERMKNFSRIVNRCLDSLQETSINPKVVLHVNILFISCLVYFLFSRFAFYYF